MIYPIRSIVAAVADPGHPDPVIAAATDLARRTGAHLHLVHAFELPSLAWDAYGRMGFVEPQVLEAHAGALRERFRAAIATQGELDHVTYHALAAPTAAAIHDVAADERADLIIVGATKRRAVARVLLGTTAQRVLRRADVPVLVVRKPLADRCRVLATTDLSPFSAGAYELGLDLLETLFDPESLEVRALLVVRSLGLPAPFTGDQFREIAENELKKFVDSRRDRGRVVTSTVRLGDPADEIAAEAEESEPDVVLVGTHSRPTTERWLLGSVAEAATRSVASNVLVVPARAEEQRELPVQRSAEAAVVPSAAHPEGG